MYSQLVYNFKVIWNESISSCECNKYVSGILVIKFSLILKNM